jgi:DNA helicase INO80
MRRPTEDERNNEEEAVRRERVIMNGPSGSNTTYDARSPAQQTQSQSEYRSTFHPPPAISNGAHLSPTRPQFNNPYHPPTPSPLPMPPRIPVQPPSSSSSTLVLGTPTYQSDYQREKPTGNYYDPTTDSSQRRPSEPSWNDREAKTSQVRSISNTPTKYIIICLTISK